MCMRDQHGKAIVLRIFTKLVLAGTSKTLRYYDRSFVLIPATAGSKAALLGWPVQIANDMLTIRTSLSLADRKGIQERRFHKERSAVNMTVKVEVEDAVGLSDYAKLNVVVGASPAMPNSMHAGSDTDGAMPHDLTPEQKQLITQFSQMTSLTLEFALICLRDYGWNIPKAMEGFKDAQVKSKFFQYLAKELHLRKRTVFFLAGHAAF
jgi:hypothetical protein